MGFFTKGKIQRTFYSPLSGRPTEPDIRKEVKKIIHAESRGAYVVYRRARRDENGHPILSNASNSNRSGEIVFYNNEGMRYLFDDYLILGSISLSNISHETGKVISYGDSRNDGRVLYLEHDILVAATKNPFDMPDEHDKIIVPKYDIEGNLGSKIQIDEVFNVGVVEPFRLDNTGRVEYYKIRLLGQMDKGHTA
ncbi:MAG: hypothetical protein PHY47_00400 [Lachnospiraceae bacterium]|nr:hypothetical protein [Lachnospiraceae bacterium]